MIVITSAFNEQDAAIELKSYLINIKHEVSDLERVILVDNGSTDGTYSLWVELFKNFPDIELIQNPDGRGWGDGIKAALALIPAGTQVLIFPSDLQFPVEDVIRVAKAALSRSDTANFAVFSHRQARSDGFLLKFRGLLWRLVMALTLGRIIKDPASQLRSFSYLPEISGFSSPNFGFDIQLQKFWVDRSLPYTELGVAFIPRKTGSTSLGGYFKAGYAALLELLRLRSWRNSGI